MTTTKEEKLSLLEKISRMTQDIGDIKKGGTNTFHKYNYVKGEDAMSCFRDVEVAHRVKVFPRIDMATLTMQEIQTKAGAKETVCTALVNFEICDLDSDSRIIVPIAAQGGDGADKAIYKLMTGAFKYFVLQVFSASGDDPEAANKQQNLQQQQPQRQQQRPPAKPPVQKTEDKKEKDPIRISEYEGKKYIFTSPKPYWETATLIAMGFKESQNKKNQWFKLYNAADEKYMRAVFVEHQVNNKPDSTIVYDEVF